MASILVHRAESRCAGEGGTPGSMAPEEWQFCRSFLPSFLPPLQLIDGVLRIEGKMLHPSHHRTLLTLGRGPPAWGSLVRGGERAGDFECSRLWLARWGSPDRHLSRALGNPGTRRERIQFWARKYSSAWPPVREKTMVERSREKSYERPP